MIHSPYVNSHGQFLCQHDNLIWSQFLLVGLWPAFNPLDDVKIESKSLDNSRLFQAGPSLIIPQEVNK